MELRDDRPSARTVTRLTGSGRAPAATQRRAPEYTRCDACGEGMQSLGHCKWLCRCCGFMRTCIDTV
jgi:ribosomal protein L34E